MGGKRGAAAGLLAGFLTAAAAPGGAAVAAPDAAPDLPGAAPAAAAALAPIPPAAPADTAPDLPGAVSARLPGGAPPLPATATATSATGPTVLDHILGGLEIEGWYQWFDQRGDTPTGLEEGHSDDTRLVFGYRQRFTLPDAFSLTFSDRLDLVQPIASFKPVTTADGPAAHTTNALRELFVGWQGGSDKAPLFIDAGRVNLRDGVSSGYNPTDFFKANAVVQTTTLDPNALREDRLGTVMLRGQRLWDWGGVTLAYAPRLSSSTDPYRGFRREPDFGADLDRTNRYDAVFAKISPQISQRLSLDVLAYAREQQNPRLGLDSALLLGSSVVVDLEAAFGRFDVLQGPGGALDHQPGTEGAGGIGGPAEWRARVAIGATWTTPVGVSLTLENDYAGDALSQRAWSAWRHQDDAALLGRLYETQAFRSAEQEPLVQEGWFVRAAADRVFDRPGLSLSAFLFIDGYDGSVLWQGDVSQTLTRSLQATLQGGGYDGGLRSEYGASTLKRYVSFYLSYRL